MFDLFSEDETLAQAKSKKRRNSTAATAPITGEKRKKPEDVFELFNGGEWKSKSRLDDSMAVTVVNADELKKRLDRGR